MLSSVAMARFLQTFRFVECVANPDWIPQDSTQTCWTKLKKKLFGLCTNAVIANTKTTARKSFYFLETQQIELLYSRTKKSFTF